MDGQFINVIIVVAYLAAMLLFGWWGKSRTKNNSDYLVAGRRLGVHAGRGEAAWAARPHWRGQDHVDERRDGNPGATRRFCLC